MSTYASILVLLNFYFYFELIQELFLKYMFKFPKYAFLNEHFLINF